MRRLTLKRWCDHWLTYSELADLTDVALVSGDAFSYEVMKVMIVKEVVKGDISPVAMFELEKYIQFKSVKYKVQWDI